MWSIFDCNERLLIWYYRLAPRKMWVFCFDDDHAGLHSVPRATCLLRELLFFAPNIDNCRFGASVKCSWLGGLFLHERAVWDHMSLSGSLHSVVTTIFLAHTWRLPSLAANRSRLIHFYTMQHATRSFAYNHYISHNFCWRGEQIDSCGARVSRKLPLIRLHGSKINWWYWNDCISTRCNVLAVRHKSFTRRRSFCRLKRK